MAVKFDVRKAKPSKTRKLPYFPRIGVVIEIGHRRISYRQVPLAETMINLIEQGINLANLSKITREQLGEIKFPPIDRLRRKTIDVKAKVVKSRSLK